MVCCVMLSGNSTRCGWSSSTNSKTRSFFQELISLIVSCHDQQCGAILKKWTPPYNVVWEVCMTRQGGHVRCCLVSAARLPVTLGGLWQPVLKASS